MYNTQNTVDHYILIATVNSRYASDIVHNIQTNTLHLFCSYLFRRLLQQDTSSYLTALSVQRSEFYR